MKTASIHKVKPNLDLRPGERGRYVVRSVVWGNPNDQFADPFVDYVVWDRTTGEEVETYTSHQGAQTLAFWLNAEWPLERARREADRKHAWAFCR